MEEYNFLYTEPEPALEQRKQAPLHQAVKAMVFGLVAITLAEIPFLGFFSAPIFAIISLLMAKDYKKKYPGQGLGFLKAGKITAIISLPLCFFTCVYWIVYIVFIVYFEIGAYNYC